ncbi:cytochrome c oxidase subunit 4 [Solihabitans fulvus]|uniref:Cytochrome c oxidase polypeptide 4 n=1 Tax=Solihabitans fulvus TaxID=1892852 RepID=A0A5B2WT15_9PSEU|nr:cytochrome c oxidase subunit 4 [Solihabitans fulvus]KAA2253017.1 cytochrome c oxidase subunit 4 [Solihabitans fulvus]
MKVEGRVFGLIAVFAVLISVVYAVWTHMATGHVEPVGTVGLALTFGLALIVWTYFSFVSRRVLTRPEDDPEAEISDGAGELGFFSPGSYWPIGLAASAALAAIGLAFWYIWVLVIAIVIVLIMVGGLVFEYHTGPNHE